MPIPDWNEPDAPEMDTRMFEFVERRREEQARARRQRIQLVAIVALGLIAIVLTVSNAVLVSRLTARPATPPVVMPPARAAAPMERQPDAGASSERAATAEPKTSTPVATKSAQVAAAATSRELSPPRADAEPATPEPATREPATQEAPSDERLSLPDRLTRTPARSTPPAGERRPAPRDSLSTAVETDPALRTARFMIRTYGPLDAEGKALAAAQFYTGEERSFWRRVVAHVRAER